MDKVTLNFDIPCRLKLYYVLRTPFNMRRNNETDILSVNRKSKYLCGYTVAAVRNTLVHLYSGTPLRCLRTGYRYIQDKRRLVRNPSTGVVPTGYYCIFCRDRRSFHSRVYYHVPMSYLPKHLLYNKIVFNCFSFAFTVDIDGTARILRARHRHVQPVERRARFAETLVAIPVALRRG